MVVTVNIIVSRQVTPISLQVICQCFGVIYCRNSHITRVSLPEPKRLNFVISTFEVQY